MGVGGCARIRLFSWHTFGLVVAGRSTGIINMGVRAAVSQYAWLTLFTTDTLFYGRKSTGVIDNKKLFPLGELVPGPWYFACWLTVME